ncbi:hypothetical protein BMS3Abin17_00597 [archaeon BMS3Abin17]|nr:hypothetical protein BMS3Abin17_00597 [archaeon BMS3Abin17]
MKSSELAIKKMQINDINIDVEMPKEIIESIPSKVVSSIRIEDKKLIPICMESISL